MSLELTYVVEGNKTLTVRFPPGVEPRLGRDPASNDVILHDPGISRAHAQIIFRGTGYAIRDLGSKKGTLVNGARAETELPLKDGDVIEIGPFILLVGVGAAVGAVAAHLSEKTFRMQLQRCPNPQCNAYVLDEFETCMTCGTPLRR